MIEVFKGRICTLLTQVKRYRLSGLYYCMFSLRKLAAVRAGPLSPTNKLAAVRAGPLSPTNKLAAVRAGPLSPTNKLAAVRAGPLSPTNKLAAVRAGPLSPTNVCNISYVSCHDVMWRTS